MRPELSILFVLAYLLGSVPFGFLAARWLKGVDLRTVGSGNIGATNAARVLGWRYFPFIFALDLLKGLAPTLAMKWLLARYGTPGRWDPSPFVILAGLCAILGHVFPVFLRFKGGKAVATSTGVFAALAPIPTLVAFVVWLAVFLCFRYISLASICAATALPLVATFSNPERASGAGVFLTGFCWLGAAMVILLHRSNIRRLLSGTENRIGRKKGVAESGQESRRV